jgi:Ca2+-transporting ATPase
MIPVILLTGLLILSFMVLSDLLISLIWAIIIAYVMWPPYQWLKFQLKNKASLSAAIMTIVIAALISLIIFGLVSLLQDESKSAYQSLAINFTQEPHQLPGFIIKIPWLGVYLQECLDQLTNDRAELISQLGDWAKQWLGGLAKFIGSVGQNAIKLGVILVTVFFCFRDGKEIIKQLQQGLVQYLGKYQHVYLKAAGNTTRAVVYGLVLAALGQGLLAGIGYTVAGVQAPLLFGALTALFALIPMGATLVWFPTGIALILMDQLWPGLGLLLWGFLVVSTVDNVIRPLVISGASRVPFLVVLFGVLGGLKTFGAVGLFLGPVILAVLLSVWQAWLKLQQEELSPDLRKQQIWHALSINEVIKCLASNHTAGLTQIIAAERLIRYGANRLIEKKPRSALNLLLSQFKSFLILVLIAAAILASTIGDLKDGIVILVVVVINALLGFYQEFKAEKSLLALKKMLSFKSKVRRDGITLEVPADQLVPGDIIILEAGCKIPADGRIIMAHTLEIDESSLTGESIPVTKNIHTIEDTLIPLAERGNMLYMNNTVTRGRSEMIVTSTGMETEIGKLAYLLTQTEDGTTPLKVQLDSLGKRMVACTLGIIIILFVAALWRGEPLIQTVFTTIALAVAAIPEGLPAVVTVTLALGMHRMARQQAIIKRLAAVETLGCTTVICTDKTGTLTVNQMTARSIYYKNQSYTVSGEGYNLTGEIVPGNNLSDLMLAISLCNNSHLQDDQVLGDPMECALLVLAAKGGINQEQANSQFPRIAEIPFDAKHKFMATFHQHGDTIKIFIKGAPEILLKLSPSLVDQNQFPFHKKDFSVQNDIMASSGLRVLGVAVTSVPANSIELEGDLFQYIKGLNFIALVGLMDPPRNEAKEAIKLCQQAGIAVKMITGDQKVTAIAIAKELGLTGQVLDGQELDSLDDDSLAASINNIGIFARTAPEQKVRIIKALKTAGHIVAMTGDGVNDAPALKISDIGIAMGITGTDVAKEAATMILTDDNFATIVKAIKEGRGIYENMIKFVRFQLSTNIGAILAVAVAPLMGMPLPFTAIQLLWINIIMDGPPAMSLGVDPARINSMDEAPRDPEVRILSLSRLGNLFSYGLTMAIGTLSLLFYELQTGTSQHATTMAFTSFVLFQLFNVFNARSEKHSTFNHYFFTNRMLWLAIISVIVLQILVINWTPAQNIFKTTPLSQLDWLIAVAVASTILILEELRKLLRQLIS